MRSVAILINEFKEKFKKFFTKQKCALTSRYRYKNGHQAEDAEDVGNSEIKHIKFP